MSVLQRKELEESPLADLHAIASELAIERYRGLRRDALVAAIVEGQGARRPTRTCRRGHPRPRVWEKSLSPTPRRMKRPPSRFYASADKSVRTS